MLGKLRTIQATEVDFQNRAQERVAISQGSYKNLEPFFKDFLRSTLDFQGPPTRDTISQIVQKCTFPVYSNKTLRIELFASPSSPHFSVQWS